MLTVQGISFNPYFYPSFLTTAANNYKYGYTEQLCIYTQKPDATACAEFDVWNRLGRWVNKGAKGIALLTDSQPYKLRYVFDVSDTNSRKGNNIRLWKMQPEYEPQVLDALENSYGEIRHRAHFPSALIDVAEQVAADNASDYIRKLGEVAGGSKLCMLDEPNIADCFEALLKNSAAYMLLSRCGYSASRFYGAEDFADVSYFSTPETLSVLGTASGDVSRMLLREIEATVRDIERNRTFAVSEKTPHNGLENKNTERGNKNEDRIQAGGRLSPPESESTREPDAREVRDAETHVPEGAQETGLHGTADRREAERSPYERGQRGRQDDGASHLADGEGAGRYGETQGERSDALGADDEQHPERGGGDRSEGDSLCVIPPEAEQKKIIAEAEDDKASAFAISQEEIDAVLTRGSGVYNGKYRIYEQYLKKESSAENITFLKNEYGWGGAYPAVPNTRIDESHDGKGIKISRGSITKPDAELLLSWNKVEKRIGELIAADRYLNTAEKEHYPEYCRQQMARKERSVIGQEFMAIIRDYNEYMRQLGNDGEQLNQYVLSDCACCFMSGEKKTTALDRKGDFIIPLMREAMERILAENTHLNDRAASMRVQLSGTHAKKLEPSYDEPNPPPETPKEYRFSLGDTVYIGAQEYELASIGEKSVSLFDVQFPLMFKEMPRAEFEVKLRENPMNDRLLHEVEPEPETDIIPPQLVDSVQQLHEKVPPDEAPTIDASEPLPPPPAETRREKAAPHMLLPEIGSNSRTNFRIRNEHLGEGTPTERFYHNVHAIELLKKLEDEHRLADSFEQDILSDYVGWGGLSEFFSEDHPHYAELKGLLTDEEYASARESTLTAFYTPPVVIQAMYEALEGMGFKTGNVLEPSCGIGNFMGLVPDGMDAKFYGVELDSISGRIAQQLYQKNSIAVQGFEKTELPDSFFDLAIGNVPFGQFKVPDKRYDKHNFLIHDYFFARAIDKVRPGGVIAFITSRGTMDKENPSVRRYIDQRAKLLGAVRLPNKTFKSAAGTEVTADILFLQKRDRLVTLDSDWIHLDTDANGMKMNSYFVQHPEMIVGEIQLVTGAHGPAPACIAREDGQSFAEQLRAVMQNIHAEIKEVRVDDLAEEEADRSIPADPNVRNFSYTVVDGDVYYRENSRMKPVELSVTAENRIKGMIGIRDCVRSLIELQTEDYPDAAINAKQQELNELYDAFSAKYGLINSRANSSVFNSDSSYYLLCSLEVIDDEGNFKRKADMFSKRTIRQRSVVTSVDTASEALALSLAEKAGVDMGYMSSLTGKSEDELADDLKGVIFRDPMYTGEGIRYLTADEYLSGNVREKLSVARLSPETYADNIQALEKVIPKDLAAGEISVRLGATWIPPEDVEQFMHELFSTPFYMRWGMKVCFSEYTGEWSIQGRSRDSYNVKANSTYGTDRINGYKILEQTLNLKDVRIFDYVEDSYGNRRAVLNKKETAVAQSKQQLIKEEFSEWIWREPERRERLVRLYNDKFNSFRPREYNGEHLSFPGMNPEITLRSHQVNAIAHMLYGGNTLLAHVVGAGKTFEMVAAAMESKRLGLCNKSLIVVPNHLTEQWASDFLQLYPAANILVATKKDFETKNRKKFCGRIATGDYDAIIIGHSQFEKIPMSVERQRMLLEQQLQEILDGIAELKRNRGDSFSIKQFERTKKSVQQKLDKLNDQSRKDDVVTFEELGVDRLFVDEAHYYKNLAAFTKMRNVGGISQTEAMKSSDLYMKCRYLDEITGGRGVVFATGTPISNSMVELYTMQKYLQYDMLRRNGLINFDSWASTFGETVTAIELAPEGSGYRAKTRFAKFYNLPELMAMFKETADIQTADMLKLPVPEAHYHTVSLKPSEQQKIMVESLAERAERVRAKMVNSSEDNMLLITNDGRKLALDQRMLNPLLPDSETSKASACAENVFRIWEETAPRRSTQMIFCDLSTPRGDGSFNVYDDIRDKLVSRGIPAEEIAYIHTANTEAQKKELFGKVRSGQVRILIGSTQKMGAGTNVQQKLAALHHLDCPWRPSDLQQREGRIIRQGNENPEVDIYTYVTENTFDSYLYQLVESKQKFIGQIMTSKSPVRSAEDVDEQALSYAEIKALCTGNPHIKEKMDLDIEVARLKLLKANHLSQRYSLEDEILRGYPQRIAALEQRIEGYVTDIETAKANPVGDKFCGMLIQGMRYDEKKEAGEAILLACKSMKSPDAIPLGTYRGFQMELSFDPFNRDYRMTLKGELRHTVTLGTDAFGNIQRLDNLIEAMPDKLSVCRAQLDNERTQLENAKAEVQKPFPREEELKIKSARLAELNALLDMDKRENEIVDGEREDGESVPKQHNARDER